MLIGEQLLTFQMHCGALKCQ